MENSTSIAFELDVSELGDIQTPSHPWNELDPASETSRLYDLRVDKTQYDRAVEIKPLSLIRPHMRSFHLAWMSAISGFFGWYAIPPLMPSIVHHLNLTKADILNSDIASNASTIISRIIIGPLCDMYGPRWAQSWLLWLGAIPVAGAAFINNASTLVALRFIIGLIGCVFVTEQYWTTITFAKNVVGTSNAVTGGLSLSGIGMAFLLLPHIYNGLASSESISNDLAWRITIALPAGLMMMMGFVIYFFSDSCPMGNFRKLRKAREEQMTRLKINTGLIHSFRVCLKDINVLILILHYGMCFGAELQLNNMGALFFHEEFRKTGCIDEVGCEKLSETQSAMIASSFGLMNLFARAVGGLLSDFANNKYGMKGRLGAHFVLLLVEGILVIVFSRLKTLSFSIALYILIAIFAQAAGGSSFGIVPYLNEPYTGTVTGLVGAGGNVGGTIFGVIFRSTGSRQEALLYMGILITISAFFTFFITKKQLL